MNTETAQLRVGDLVELKVECLGNPKGTKGLIFNDYREGVQVIFPNGEYDGFSTVKKNGPEETEFNNFLEIKGHSIRFSNYKFVNIIRLTSQFDNGFFKEAFTNE